MSVRKQCKVLDIHRSNVYYCPKKPVKDLDLIARIRAINREYPYYGYRKIHHCLKEQGHSINHKKVHRLMKADGLQAIYPKPRTSIRNTQDSVFEYLLKDVEVNKPNQVWAVDITYIRLPGGMVYLFGLIDWHSRFIVSHRLVSTMEAMHGVEAIEEALTKYGQPEICNADQGRQFTGDAWINKLKSHTIKISHDGKGRCIDNVRIERFWRTIKYEDTFLSSYENLKEARQGTARYIEHYNYKRPHQALDYQTPAKIYFKGN